VRLVLQRDDGDYLGRKLTSRLLVDFYKLQLFVDVRLWICVLSVSNSLIMDL
jgi:hypothetical protein